MKALAPLVMPLKRVPFMNIKPQEMGKKKRKTLKEIEGVRS